MKAAAESVVVERVVAAAACAYLGDGGLLVANGGLSRLLPLPPLERVEAAEGVLRLHAAGSRSPPLSVLLLPPPLERVEAAGGLRRLHKAGSLLPQPSVPLPPLLERIEAACGVLKPHAASWTPPLPSVLSSAWRRRTARWGGARWARSCCY